MVARLRGLLLLVPPGLSVILGPAALRANSFYTVPCRPGIPGARINWTCGSNSGIFTCCAGFDRLWAYGRCYEDAQCGPGSYVCYYPGDDYIYRTEAHCCAR